MARRGRGEGSIYKNKALGTWVGQYTAGFSAEGKQIKKYVYGKTREEVKDKLNVKLADITLGKNTVSSSVTLGHVVNNIVEAKYDSGIMSINSYIRGKATAKHIIDSPISSVKINKITSTQLQDFINSKRKLSNSYISKIYGMLNLAFKKAISLDYMYKSPMMNVIKPKSETNTKKVTALTLEQQKSLIGNLEGTLYQDVILVGLFSGMRVGEILSLSPEDIDFNNKLIRIAHTITRGDKGKAIIGKTTKTYSGTREIPLTKKLAEVFTGAIQKMKPNKNNLIFTLEDGSIVPHATVNASFKTICKKIGIYNITFHSLRHTYATRCIEAGINATVLQRLLGHKDIQTTLNTYTDVFNKFKKDEIDKLDSYLEGKNIL